MKPTRQTFYVKPTALALSKLWISAGAEMNIRIAAFWLHGAAVAVREPKDYQ